MRYSTYYSQYDSATTNDKVFLLSWDDALYSSYGFSLDNWDEDTARQAHGSDYAKSQGLWVSSYSGNSIWILRFAGGYSSNTCYVYENGCVNTSGHGPEISAFGVRPALHLQNLKSDTADISVYTVTFKADGVVVDTVEYAEGQESIEEPIVPEKEGYTGKWEEYTLTPGGITVNAIYTKIPNPTPNAKLKVPANTEVEYAATVTVTAKATGVPKGYYVALYDVKTQLKKGSNTEVSYTFPDEFKETKNITVKIIDSKGNVQKDANGKDLTGTVEIKSKSGFFAKLIAFFKRLFKALPAITVEPK